MPHRPQHTPARHRINYLSVASATSEDATTILDQFVSNLSRYQPRIGSYAEALAWVDSTTPLLAESLMALRHIATGVSATGSVRVVDESDRKPLIRLSDALKYYMGDDPAAEQIVCAFREALLTQQYTAYKTLPPEQPQHWSF